MNCEKCGKELEENATSCFYCGEPVANEQTIENEQTVANEQPEETINDAPTEPAKPENIITGFIGALIGALIGGLVIVLIGQLGFIASISGAILAFCTIKGYQLLGHRLGIAGMVICLLFIAVTPYFADRIVWALQLVKEFDAEGIPVTFADAYYALPDLIKDGLIDKGTYIKDLLVLYAFAVLGGYGTIKDSFKK